MLFKVARFCRAQTIFRDVSCSNIRFLGKIDFQNVRLMEQEYLLIKMRDCFYKEVQRRRVAADSEYIWYKPKNKWTINKFGIPYKHPFNNKVFKKDL